MRGAKITAIGTAAAPIVFTSSRQPGQRQPGDWGGLIIIGNAPTTVAGRSTSRARAPTAPPSSAARTTSCNTTAVRSRPTTPARCAYVRVEFAGFAPLQNQELNSFTFAAVGIGTTCVVPPVAGRPRRLVRVLRRRLRRRSPRRLRDRRRLLRHVGGFSGRIQFLVAQSTTQLVPRTDAGFYVDRSAGDRERRLQRLGLRPRLNSRRRSRFRSSPTSPSSGAVRPRASARAAGTA